jgi:hypothetical protein
MIFSNNKDPYSKKVGENLKYSLIIGGITVFAALVYKGILWLLVYIK